MMIDDPHQGDDRKASLPVEFGRMETLFSDHRPIHGVYKVHLVHIDRAKRKEIRKRILDNEFVIEEDEFYISQNYGYRINEQSDYSSGNYTTEKSGHD